MQGLEIHCLKKINKNIQLSELKERLDSMGISNSVYSINSVEYPNEAYVIIFNGTEWEVYYSERGKKRGLKKYLDESEACERFINQISRI